MKSGKPWVWNLEVFQVWPLAAPPRRGASGSASRPDRAPGPGNILGDFFSGGFRFSLPFSAPCWVCVWRWGRGGRCHTWWPCTAGSANREGITQLWTLWNTLQPGLIINDEWDSPSCTVSWRDRPQSSRPLQLTTDRPETIAELKLWQLTW